MSNDVAFCIDPENVPLRKPGAYLIRNMVNGKCYVGISQNVARRLAGHARADGTAVLLSRAVRKHGAAAFEAVPLLYSLGGTDFLPLVEAALIEAWRGLEGYNVQAASGAVGPYGDKFSAAVKAAHAKPETRARMRAASRAWASSEAGQAHLEKAQTTLQSPEVKAKRAAGRRAYFDSRPKPEPKPKRAAVRLTTEARGAIMREVHSRPDVKERHRASVIAANADRAVKEKLAASRRGRVWITDGITSRCVYPDAPMLEGWRRGKCR